jgi:hypothetical protein
VDRHINFFELEKATAKSGCPLCRIVADRTERYIDNMLFEHVSDRTFRAAYRAAGGFCAEHSRRLSSFRDGLAVAILGRDVLSDHMTAFSAGKAWKPGLSAQGRKDAGLGGRRDGFDRRTARCPVCAEQDHLENEYLTFLAEATGDSQDEQDLREALNASDGLCMPHYNRLLETTKHVPHWLRALHEARFAALLERTAAFIEYSAWGRQEDFAKLSPKDKVVWKELALTLRGGGQED